jgi:hypothetical protein
MTLSHDLEMCMSLALNQELAFLSLPLKYEKLFRFSLCIVHCGCPYVCKPVGKTRFQLSQFPKKTRFQLPLVFLMKIKIGLKIVHSEISIRHLEAPIHIA